MPNKDSKQDTSECIKPSYLAHYQFHEMPLIEFQDRGFLDISLDLKHSVYLPDAIQGRVSSIDKEKGWLECLTTVIVCEVERQKEGQ